MANWHKVGSILKRKDGKGQYIKVANDTKLTKGQIVNIQNPRNRPGITEEQLEKIPEFVLADLFLPPNKEE